jgi:hypothetical protein
MRQRGDSLLRRRIAGAGPVEKFDQKHFATTGISNFSNSGEIAVRRHHIQKCLLSCPEV